jgi:hypothetical protein
MNHLDYQESHFIIQKMTPLIRNNDFKDNQKLYQIMKLKCLIIILKPQKKSN